LLDEPVPIRPDYRQVELVDVTISGAPTNGWGGVGGMTPDGRHVVFSSTAASLVPNDTDTAANVFVRNMTELAPRLVSRTSDGTPVTGVPPDV